MKLLLFIFSLALLSCNAVKQSEHLYQKAKDKSLPTVAAHVRLDFPCIVKKSDTVIKTEHTTSIDTLTETKEVEIPCPDTNGVKVVVKYKVETKYINRTDTFYLNRSIYTLVEDSAKINVMQSQIDKQAAVITKTEKGKSTWRTIAFSSIAFLLLAIAFFVFTIIQKEKNKLKSV